MQLPAGRTAREAAALVRGRPRVALPPASARQSLITTLTCDTAGLGNTTILIKVVPAPESYDIGFRQILIAAEARSSSCGGRPYGCSGAPNQVCSAVVSVRTSSAVPVALQAV